MSATNRGSKPGRDKTGKTNHIQNGKTDAALAGGKNQPTAEQLRIAELTSMSDVDPEVAKKILQVSELTGRSKDEALTALYDCDYDANRAVEALLEKQGDQAEEWQEIGKKKKAAVGGKGSQVGGSGEMNSLAAADSSGGGRTNNDVITSIEIDRSEQRERGGDSIPRGRRDRAGPPRFQRGRGFGSANGDKGGSTSRERPQIEQGRGFPRRRGGNTSAVGGGRGGYPIRGYSTGRNSYESGPQIDTWTNDKTVNGKETSATPDWGEDWTNDEWSGSLDESRVFTASTSLASSTTAYDPLAVSSATAGGVLSGGSDPAVLSAASAAPGLASSSFFDPSNLGGQVYIASSTATSAAAPLRSAGHAPPLSADEVTPMVADTSSGAGVYRSASLLPATNASTIGAHHDTAALTTGILEHYGLGPELSAAYLSRYTKEATEVIKNAVGIGNSAMGGHAGLGGMDLTTSQSTMQNCGAVAAATVKQPRPRLPPPSKIPASAVEMPASMNSGQLDVQFGNWDPPAAATVSSSAAGNEAATLSFTADISTTAQTHYGTSAVAHSMAQQQQPSASSVLHGGVNNISGSYEMSTSVARSSMMATSAVSDPSKAAMLMLDDLGMGSGSSGSVASKPSPVTGYQSSSGTNVTTKDYVNSKLQMSSGPPSSSTPFSSSLPDRKPNTYQSQAQPAPVSTQTASHPSMPFSQVSSYVPGSDALAAAAPSSVYKSVTSTSAGLAPAFTAQQMGQYGSSSFGGYVNTDGSAGVQFASYSGTAAPGFGPQPQMVSGMYGMTQQQQQQQQQQQSQGSSYPAGPTSAHKSYGSGSMTGSTADKPSQQPSGATSSSAYPNTGLSQQYDVTNSYQLGAQLAGSSGTGGGSGYQMSPAAPYPGHMSYQGVSYQSVAPGYESGVGAGFGGSHSSYSQNLYAQQRQGRGDSAVPTGGSGYPSVTDVQTGTVAAAAYQQRASQAYNAAQQQQPTASATSQMPAASVATGKLTDGLGKLTLKDAASSSGASQYDASSVSVNNGTQQQQPASLSTATTTTSSAGVGLLPATATTSSAARTTSSTVTTTKSSAPVTSKAMVTLPVGGPAAAVLNNYMIAQPPGFQLAHFGYPATQQPMTYTFEDLQLLQQQQRFPVPYYDMPFQPTTTGRDATSSMATQNYASGNDLTKLAQIDPMSPVALQPAAQQQQQQVTVAAQPGTAAAAAQQQQSYLNPAAIHPAAPTGYSYYYPGTAGIMPVGSYYTPMIQMGGMVPLANPPHGVTTATTQYQKAAMYGSHAGYGVGGQTQDFTKTFGASQTSGKGSVTGTGGATSDVLTGGAPFSKNHVQTYDKSGFHSGTPPPPFNMGMPSGPQTGAAAALGGGYGAPYMPMMPQHQSHSAQILHHPMSQDASLAGRGSVPQNAGQQPKAGGANKAAGAYSTGYWGAN